MKELKIPQTYDELVRAIRKVQAQSKKRLEQALNREKVREAWETGRLIDAHVLQHKERADYGSQVIKRLASDLGVSESELYYCLEFARTYPIFQPAGKLGWSHYQALLSINDPVARKEVEDLAVRNKWTRDQVREEVARRQSRSLSFNTDNLPEVEPGKVNTYRVVKASAGVYAGRLGVDLGFSTYFLPAGIRRFREGDLVLLAGGKLKKSSGGESDLYTYIAHVTQVIDGDTFHALVNLGFGVVTEQKLRLSRLDAAIVESTDGREAKEFLERQLLKNSGQILLRTVKSDKYDRYLADVWIDGTWVNQELIDKRLAVRVRK